VKVTLLCHPRLARLFTGLGFDVLAAQGRVEIPPCDAWALSPSLPLRVGSTPETVPPPLALRGGPAGAQRGVGFTWRCNLALNPQRAVPEPVARGFIARTGAISLEPEDTGAVDFQDTADLIAGLERVIAVDSAIAHLAASMAKPCDILLPPNPDWKWFGPHGRSPWYPDATLHWRAETEDWGQTLAGLSV
jgi:hypothetical protein